CTAEDIPFFLEILSYDEKIADNSSAAFAKVKAHKVNGAMKVFSEERFGIDVLKVEVPVNMAYVDGFAKGEVLYSQAEAAQAFRD
ncbi:UNVERIFIED_CONTAM: tagatose-bisphosphate aldolase, partial [Streptococcus canis]